VGQPLGELLNLGHGVKPPCQLAGHAIDRFVGGPQKIEVQRAAIKRQVDVQQHGIKPKRLQFALTGPYRLDAVPRQASGQQLVFLPHRPQYMPIGDGFR
jgi:hypothetical protein